MKFAGIDPGLSGGIFLIDSNLQEIYSLRFSGTNSKLDIEQLLTFLQFVRPEVIYIEQIFLAGREGGRSALTIGANYGRITAVLDAIGLTYTEVAPRTWQRALELKSGSREIVKQSAQDLAVKRFGTQPFLFGRSRKPHDGLTDAACLALYAIQQQSELLWDDPKKKSTKNTQSSASSTATSAKGKSASKRSKPKQSSDGTKSLRKSKRRSSTQKDRSTDKSKTSRCVG